MSPSSGSGTGTPIGGGAVPSSDAIALPYTLLSLPRFAKIMGINPAHFWRASAPGLNPQVFPVASCSDVWPRFSWQNVDQVSHEELAYAIANAEEDIAKIVGFYPAPTWIAEEHHQYAKLFDRQYYDYGINIRGKYKSANCRYGRYITGGRRSVDLVGTPSVMTGTLSYTDGDGDGLYETATIIMSTTVTDASQLKLYFSGTGGQQEWEIRPIRRKILSGGTITFIVDSWYLIDPMLLSEYPTSDGFRTIDISDTSNFVASVDIYREYADPIQPAAVFSFEDGNGCGTPPCEVTEQDGCLYPRNDHLGIAVPVPATYSEDSSSWIASRWAGSREPDMVRIWYYAGEKSNQFSQGYTPDPLSDWWAQTITWVAAARLTRPLCGCNNARDLADNLAEDLSTIRGAETTFYLPVEVMRNPLGTKRGEVMAWRRITKLVDKKVSFAVI